MIWCDKQSCLQKLQNLWYCKHHPVFLLKVAQSLEDIEASHLITIMIMTMKFTKILKPYSRGKQRWWSRWSQRRQTEGGWALLSPCHLQPANQLRPRKICVLLNFSGDDHDLVVPITVSNISKNPCIGSLERGDKADQVADVRLDCFWTFGP